MSFHSSAQSLRSRLHLHKYKPSSIAAFLIFALVASLAIVIGVVQLVREHAVSVVRSDEVHEQVDDSISFANEEVVSEQASASEVSNEKIVVYVSGAVVAPGLYEMAEGSRVGAAVDLAGGGLDEAALESVNLARVVYDGEQIHVPTCEEVESGLSAATGFRSGAQANVRTAIVNINTAGVDQLTTLDGVGEATAGKIIADREANGPFSTIEDLMRVSGIGQKKFDAIKDRICV